MLRHIQSESPRSLLPLGAPVRQYVFTIHAKERMEFRGITEAMVRETVERPERTGIGYRRRRLAFRRYSAGVLKVVYTKKGQRAIIISTIWE